MSLARVPVSVLCQTPVTRDMEDLLPTDDELSFRDSFPHAFA